MNKRNFIIKVKATRESYFPVYLMILAIILAIAYLFLIGYEVNNTLLISSIVFAIILVKVIEIHRQRDWWALTESNLVESKSILNKNIREIDYSSISGLELDQPLYKRMLNYGTIVVRMHLNGAPIFINNIKNPEEFLRKAQKIIFEKRRPNNETR